MALQSQSPRDTAWRGSGSSRQNRKAVMTVVFGLAVLVGGAALVVLLLSRVGSKGETSPGGGATVDVGQNSAALVTSAMPVNPQPGTQAGGTAGGTAGGGSVPVAPVLSNVAPSAAPVATPVTTPAAVPATAGGVGGGGAGATTPASAPVTGTPASEGASAASAPATDSASGLPGDLAEWLRRGAALMAQGNLLEARTLLNRAMLDGRLPEREREAVRRQVASLNETLVFGPAVAPGDPLFGMYTVVAGDNATKIMRSQAPFVDRLFLGRINKLADLNKVRVGQQIKVPRQPFHLIVHKDAFRADLYMGPPLPPEATMSASQPVEAKLTGWTYIRSFAVGLGESNGTPEGLFTVKANSKLIDPEWINPRDRTRYAPRDPANPIGDRWVGLEGAEERTRAFVSYGIHGTVQNDSIGKQMSMGCIRLLKDDIHLAYEVLAEKLTHVWIVK